MKMTYKNLLSVASSILLCLFLAFPAGAQRTNTGGGNSGGGGGTSRPSGGGGSSGGGSSARPSGGGSVSQAPRSSGGGNVGVSRQSVSNQRNSVAPRGSYGVSPRGNYGVTQQRPGYINHQGITVRTNNGISPQSNINHQGITVRGNYGYAPRTGVTATGYVPRTGIAPGGSGYRTAPAIGYGRGGYWGNHGYYHYAHGYYNSYYLPRIGFQCGFLPYGYYPFFWGDYQYFYSDGLFYQYDNSEYTVVEPPIGAEITTLPDKAQSIVINGQQYYELNGVYYQPIKKDDGTIVYQIAGKDGELNTTSVQDDQQQGPQMGDIVTQLPPDCRKIKVSGQKLWVSPDGVYYQEQVDANNNKTYKVVGLPSDEPDQN